MTAEERNVREATKIRNDVERLAESLARVTGALIRADTELAERLDRVERWMLTDSWDTAEPSATQAYEEMRWQGGEPKKSRWQRFVDWQRPARS